MCECPVGYSCSSSTQTEPKQCDQGYYQDKRAQGKCEPCEAGFYCYQYYLIPPKTPTICPNGHKCLPLSTNPTKCEVGTYQDEQGKNECKLCPIGQYSKIIGQSKCKTCEAGFMCDTEGISTYKTDCPKGYYCLAGTNMSPNGCDTSQISNVTDDLIYPNACEEGFYCPGKTIFPISCGVRSYNPYPCQSACINCPNGYMCSKTGMSEPTPCPIGFACFDDSQISCTPGHYCLDRTETNNPDLDVERKPLPCAKGHFCTGGNVLGVYDSDIKNSAAYCSYGTYMNETGASECYKCPAGYECLDQGMIEPVICPSGTYRIEGLTPISCTECPEGTYNNRTGATSPDYCIACEGGLVCIASRLSWLNSTNSELCSAGYFCPAGTNRATRNDYHCAAGFYCFTGTASKNESEMNICPEGRYCTAGTAASEAVYAECLKGAECKIGLTCTPGSYCPAGSPEVLNCPIGLTSYSSAKSVKDCFRDTSNFYDVDIVAVQNAFPTFTIKPNTYLEFSLDFT